MSSSPPKPWETASSPPAASSEGAQTSSNTESSSTLPYTPPPTAQVVSPAYGGMGIGYGGGAYGGYGGSAYGGYGGSAYGGYGSSAYGSSAYGNSAYGNSAYGNSAYGGYGGNTYGMNSRYGMMGGNMMQGMMGPGTVIHSVEKSVNSFGRFSELLHMNLDALHMSFSSFLQLITNVSMIRQEFGTIFSEAVGLKTLFYLYNKLKQLLRRLWAYITLSPEQADMESVFKSTPNKKGSSWTTTVFSLLVGLWLFRRLLYRLVHGFPPEPPQLPNHHQHQPYPQQQQQQPPFQNTWNTQGFQ